MSEADTSLSEWGLFTVNGVMILVFLDLFLSWVQADEQRWPLRFTRILVVPLLVGPRLLLSRVPTAGWDLSPVLLVVLLTVLRIMWMP